jgi:dephospho-CoA kinase
MKAIGVTGGIGSGKSALCKVWEGLGAVVVYADDLAKNLMISNPSVKESISSVFGSRSYNDDGSLNKPHLIKEAFEKGRVEELNQIVHPAVGEAFREICSMAEKQGEKIVVKEAALLLNDGRPDDLDLIVLVMASEQDKIDRVTSRDGVNESDVLNRINKQPDFEKLKSYADYVLYNDGTLEEFKIKAEKLFADISKTIA